MRLLHFSSTELVSTDFSGKRIPPYAILSHRWDGDNEVLFEDLRKDSWKKKPGRKKIEFCAKQAAKDQLQYFWIDTCCIDKWNIRELSNAINSMFDWYKNSAKCYVFLDDVSLPTVTLQSGGWEASFRTSKWFTRGWTLQELIAPLSVEFFSCEEQQIGTKTTLEQLVHEVTGLPLEALRNSPLDEFTTSERMRWASHRKTTEEEDNIYCLLGILNVSLTPSYGEGREKALRRLQTEMESSSSAPAIIPFARNTDFVGRESELAELEEKLFGAKQTGPIVIVGPGGTGKSQLALELAYKTIQKNRNFSVFWVDARDIDSLDQGYSNIAKKLCIPGWDDDKADAKQLVNQYLSREGARQSLLILDNVDSITIRSTGLSTSQTANLTDYLPKSALCSIVFTTTNSDTAKKLAGENSLVQVVELGGMSPTTAQKMLKNYLNHPVLSTTEQYEVELLMRELSYLPLAIAQATAYFNVNNSNTRNTTLREYRLQLARRAEEGLEHSAELPKDMLPKKSPVATTLLISLDQICEKHSLAADYLYLAACVDPRDIPVNLLQPSSPEERKDAISILSSYALITRRPAESAFDLHQLVHNALREWPQRQGWLHRWTRITITQLLRLFPSYEQSSRSKWRRLLPHAKYILSNSPAKEGGKDRSELEWKCAMALFSDGRYNEAEELFMQVVETRKKKLGADHPSTLTSMGNLASTYRSQGRWNVAEELEVQVMEARKKTLGADHPDTLSSMSNLGSTFCNQGRWGAAERLFVQAMAIYTKKLGTNHPDTLTSMANLATTYRNQGRWDAAEELEVRVVETRRQKLGADHLDTLTCMANLACTLSHQGRWDAAEELEVHVLETHKKKLGANHPDTLTSMANLASTYRSQGRWGAAEELDEQVMEASKKELGADHPDTLISMANLASTYRNQGRWDKAEELEVQVVETSKNKLGADHPNTLTSMVNLASTYRNQGRWDAAEELFMQIIETRKKKLGAEHPDTLTNIGNLATTYLKQGRWDAAEELGVQVMETFKRRLGADHPETLTSMAILASTYRGQSRWDAAEELDVEVMETRKKKLGADHPDTLTSMAMLASTLCGQGRWDAAEKLEVQVMETRKKKLGADHPSTVTSMANLASTYLKQRRWDAAEELGVQVVETNKKKLGADHPSTIVSMNNLAYTWHHQSRNREAIELMNESVQLMGRILGVNHRYYTSSVKALTRWEAEQAARQRNAQTGNKS